MAKGLNGEPSFNQHKPDVIHSVEAGSEAGEPVCIVDGARDGSVEIGTRCLVDQCEVVCTGTDQSVRGCAEFARDLAKLVIRKKIVW
ncbi:hypothetical protein KC960_02535 [Candidatus Saccharibacteria bacterium]|nr:hypothetical protein [Candidatus Saccharibacteria bacterium]